MTHSTCVGEVASTRQRVKLRVSKQGQVRLNDRESRVYLTVTDRVLRDGYCNRGCLLGCFACSRNSFRSWDVLAID